MNTDYGEIICKAVDEIVSAKLQGLQYDITKLCTIVDDTYSYQGKYTVSDGTARYDAFTTDVNLKKGNQVQVNIPNGDYSMQKTIVGRIATTDTTPFHYISPLDTMIKITNNLFDNTKTVHGINDGLLANGDKTLSGPIYSLKGTGDLAGYTRLGLSASFRSLLNGLDVVSGSYGIKVLIYTNMTRVSGEAPENTVYELTFSSADMIGNPYQFGDYFYQEKVFDISNITNIQKIDVYFYQDSNFKNGDGEDISHTSAFAGTVTNNPNNLFVKDVKIFLGYEVGAFTEEMLMLYTDDSMTYRYDKKEKKDVYLRWIHKIDEKNYQILNNSDIVKDNKYEIRWFRYSPGYSEIDQYAGKDWELVQNEEFLYYLFPNEKNQNERIKVVGLIRNKDDTAATAYFSNILIFENEELVPDQTTLEASTALSIHCVDGTEGNYFLYNQNGKLINEGQGKGHIRRFKAMYQGAEITSDLGTINWIQWYFPLNEKTMLVTTDDMFVKNDGNVIEKKLSYRGVDYIVIERNNPTKDELYQEYFIDNFWNYQQSNNTVICRLSLNGIEYEAIKELHFGKAGTNGTNMSFLIDFVGNDNALDFDKDIPTLTVQAKLYCDGEEQSVGFSSAMADNITWEWYQFDDNSINISSLTGITTTLSLTLGKGEYDFTQNFHILKATYNYNGQKLEAFLPIPYRKNDCAYIEGAREIIYNAQGNPQYYNDAYVAYKYNETTGRYEEIKLSGSPVSWKISYNEKQKEYLNYMPTLEAHPNRKGYNALSARSFYIPLECDAVCVSSSYWSQPILIMQSKYDFAMLNDWDGTFEINSEDGTILSTMLSAGRKNADNTFSGVLIGDVQAGTGNEESTDALTGVYGLSHGVVSYALKEDGTATFGVKGKGQVQIDGNGGTIKSAEYDKIDDGIATAGMLIDLDDGVIDIKGTQKNSSGFKFTDEDGKVLLNVGSKKQFLRSNTYGIDTQGNQVSGTSLDLKTGNFISLQKNKTGSIEITPNSDNYLMRISDKDSKVLLCIGDEESGYYLQSSGYLGTSLKTENGYQVYTNVQTSLKNGNNTISMPNVVYVLKNEVYLKENNDYKKFNFQDTTIIFTFSGKDGDGNIYTTEENYTYKANEYKNWFISQLIPQFTSANPSGMRIDLNNGIIAGYNLFLKGTKTDDNNQFFVFDSSAETYPIQVGSNFSVEWDGTVHCKEVASLISTKASGQVININNNYTVNANGSASCSGLSTGSLSVGGYGYSGKSISSGGKTYYILGR